ncbi:MAG TPA: RcnB family protein [Rhizomicrobium sp.]|nr:RcnB family protein [Rhizomicrobium sp.]
MKKLVISAMALGLLLAAPAAMAAPDDHNRDRGHGAGQTRGENSQMHVRGANQGQRNMQRGRYAHPAVYQAQQNYGQQRSMAVHERNSIRSANRARSGAMQAERRANSATMNANRATSRANFATFRANERSAQRYHWNNYQRPSGWYAHRWTYGERLPAAYYGSNYWIGDFVSFGLMAPPSGLVWVRDDNDALLINRYTGEIVRVEYDVFY